SLFSPRAACEKSFGEMQRSRDVSPSEIELRAIREDEPDKTRLLPTEQSRADQLLDKSSKPLFYRLIPYLSSKGQAKWRSIVLLGAATSSIVLIINLGFTISVTSNHSVQNWIGTIYSGDCTTTKNRSVFLHLVINILSTILLSSSNYCMVRFLAP